MLHVIFFEPRIPGNTGAAIRLSANTGSMLHLVDPLFDMEDSKLRRAGLDYHDLANTRVHPVSTPTSTGGTTTPSCSVPNPLVCPRRSWLTAESLIGSAFPWSRATVP